MLFAMLPSSQGVAVALTHLKDLNDHVAAVIGSGESALWASPRQEQPCASGGVGVLAGTSSFAYMGTNAHAVMGGPGREGAAVCRGHAGALWERRRQHVAAKPHHLLERVVGGAAEAVVLEGRVGAHAGWYMWDHQVSAQKLHDVNIFESFRGILEDMCVTPALQLSLMRHRQLKSVCSRAMIN